MKPDLFTIAGLNVKYLVFSCMRKMSSRKLSCEYKGVFLLENVNYHGEITS